MIIDGRVIQIPKTEQELIAAQYCKANSSALHGTYEEGRLSQTHQKTYALMGSQLGDNPEDKSNSIQGTYMIKLFQENTLKEMNIFAQSVRTYFFVLHLQSPNYSKYIIITIRHLKMMAMKFTD